MTSVRGQVYSLFSLAEALGLPASRGEEVSVAVIESGKVRYGLIADRFRSEVDCDCTGRSHQDFPLRARRSASSRRWRSVI